MLAMAASTSVSRLDDVGSFRGGANTGDVSLWFSLMNRVAGRGVALSAGRDGLFQEKF